MNLDRRYLTIIITFFVTAVLLIGGVMLWQYFTSFHKVSFKIEPASLSADIYQLDLSIPEDETGKKVATAQNGKQLTLQEGKYYAMPTDKKYATDHIAFDVKKEDTTVTVNPGFSDQYLSDLLKKEWPDIYRAMLAKYPKIATTFTVQDTGKLYLDGTWYAVRLLQHNPDPSGQSGDIYSAVLRKEGGTWKFVTTPKLVLTTPENPNIPKNILEDLSTWE